jgi:hypothetical protein
MSQSSSLAQVRTINLKPVYISLALDRTYFQGTAASPQARIFDTVISLAPKVSDLVWLFRGAECYRFNIRTKQFEQGPLPIAGTWGGKSWPGEFATKADAALWGGPHFEELKYFFQANKYIRLIDKPDKSRII